METFIAILLTIFIMVYPIYRIIRKIIRKHKENVILNNEYRKAKEEQKKDSK